jgi:hypothetical protein
MREYIRDRVGRMIGYFQVVGDQVEYWLIGRGGLIGIWYPKAKQYFRYGEAGSGMAAQSDIGAGEVMRVHTLLNG